MQSFLNGKGAEGMPAQNTLCGRLQNDERYYTSAFRSLETDVIRVRQFAALTHFLVEQIEEDRQREPGKPIREELIDHLFFVSSEAVGMAQDLENDWTKKHNAGTESVQ